MNMHQHEKSRNCEIQYYTHEVIGRFVRKFTRQKFRVRLASTWTRFVYRTFRRHAVNNGTPIHDSQVSSILPFDRQYSACNIRPRVRHVGHVEIRRPLVKRSVTLAQFAFFAGLRRKGWMWLFTPPSSNPSAHFLGYQEYVGGSLRTGSWYENVPCGVWFCSCADCTSVNGGIRCLKWEERHNWYQGRVQEHD